MVIRDRVGTYLSVPAPKIETMRPAAIIAAEILSRLSPNLPVLRGVRTRS